MGKGTGSDQQGDAEDNGFECGSNHGFKLVTVTGASRESAFAAGRCTKIWPVHFPVQRLIAVVMRQQLSADAILGTTEFADFHHAAVQFCEFIEEPPSNLGLGFLHKARQQLIDLYKTAIRLPWVDLKSDVDFDHQIDDKKYKEILDSISIRLGGANFYWHVFDPTNEKDTKAVCGDLVDDLGDIYKDLKYSLMTFDLNLPDCKENALWEFKSGFETHWDDHCINALSAIHFYLQNEWSESPTEIQ